MVVRLSKHLKLRIKVRRIDQRLPLKVIEESQEIYFDKETKHWVAVKEEQYAGKTRPMIAIFDKINGDVEIITVYPSNKKEIESRIKRGRWIYEKTKN